MKKFIVLLALVLVVALGLLGCNKRTSTWEEQYDLGVRYLSEGNYVEAILAFNAAIEIDPKRPEAYVGLAKVYIARDDPEKAVEILTRAEEACGESDVLDDAWEELNLSPEDEDGSGGSANSGKSSGPADGEETGGTESGPDEDSHQTAAQRPSGGSLRVLDSQSVYRPDGTLCETIEYFYNENGYMIRQEHTDYNENEVKQDVTVETWKYIPETGTCLHFLDPKFYRSDEEWERSGQVEEGVIRGTFRACSGYSGMTAAACLDPLLITPDEEVRATGILQCDYNQEAMYGLTWDYAEYTFDGDGNPVAISSYTADGTLTGTATLEWEILDAA